MQTLTYLGGAQDHEVVPQEYALGTDGKPDRRRVPKKQAENVYKGVKTYKLWGQEFPEGVPVKVANKKLIAKAEALGCFDISGEPDVRRPQQPEKKKDDQPPKK